MNIDSAQMADLLSDLNNYRIDTEYPVSLITVTATIDHYDLGGGIMATFTDHSVEGISGEITYSTQAGVACLTLPKPLAARLLIALRSDPDKS